VGLQRKHGFVDKEIVRHKADVPSVESKGQCAQHRGRDTRMFRTMIENDVDHGSDLTQDTGSGRRGDGDASEASRKILRPR
jgi:hypothetical protein